MKQAGFGKVGEDIICHLMLMIKRVSTKDEADASDFIVAPVLKIFYQSLAIVVYSRRTHENYAASEPHGSIN
jgi:hypothetical protein